jgi:hypothetical protein
MPLCPLCGTDHPLFGPCPAQQFPKWARSARIAFGAHPSLEALLRKVWATKGGIRDFWPIYELYNKPEADAHNRLERDSAKYRQYLSELSEIERKNECYIVAQGYGRGFRYHYLLDEWKKSLDRDYLLSANLAQHILNQYINPQRLQQGKRPLAAHRPEAKIETTDYFSQNFPWGFFHFIPYTPPLGPDKQPADITQRVYLNLKAQYATKVMAFIVNAVVVGLPGIAEAKICGPAAVGERTDVVVIYSKGEVTTNAVLERLAEYQRLENQDKYFERFVKQTPLMTEQARLLHGVSVGAEPRYDPDELPEQIQRIQGIRGQQSFGSFRARLIYQALQTVKKGRDKDFESFKSLVIRYFIDAGLEPMNPFR